MFLELYRHAYLKNLRKLLGDFISLEKIVQLNITSSEEDIIKKIYQKFSSYRRDLGNIRFKNRQYSVFIEGKRVKSHKKKCESPLLPKLTELGDLIFLIDHILYDNKGKKVVSGTASCIQAKKMTYVKKEGINLRQLFLMNYWPKFFYKKKIWNREWEFDVTPDLFSFYMFINDTTKKSVKDSTMMISSPSLTNLLNLDENEIKRMLNLGKETYKPKNLSIFRRERINGSLMYEVPFSMRRFLLKALYPSLGSQSLKVREFLRRYFFKNLENIHDCAIESTPSQSLSIKEMVASEPPFRFLLPDDEDDGDIFAIRLEFTAKRIE